MSVDGEVLPPEDAPSPERPVNVDPLSLILAQLSGQGADNPVLPLLSTLLEQRRSSPPAQGGRDDAAADGEDRSAIEAALAQCREADRRMHELRANVSNVYAELEALRERNDTLAAALGACYLCFGTDPLCGVCRGRGMPGSRAPEPAAYREFVVPALRRAHAAKAKAQAEREPHRGPPISRPAADPWPAQYPPNFAHDSPIGAAR